MTFAASARRSDEGGVPIRGRSLPEGVVSQRCWFWPGVLAFCLVAGGSARGQETIDDLKRQIAELRETMEKQRVDFETRLNELSETHNNNFMEMNSELQKKIDTLDHWYARPQGPGQEPAKLFTALQRLIFTGQFRTRGEYRTSNLDFRSGGDGLDDSGVRLDGRFRLGFGASLNLLDRNPDDVLPDVNTLIELQSVGAYANNSFVNIPGPGGVPLPAGFNILTEPLEEVVLYQGWVEFAPIFVPDLSFRFGRQEIVLGNHFVFGNNEFFSGTVHDAVRLTYSGREFAGSLFYAKEAASDGNLVTSIEDFDQDELATLYLTFRPDEIVDVDVYYVYFNARSNAENLFLTGTSAFFLDGAINPALLGHFSTVGARVHLKSLDLGGGHSLALNVEGAFQFGDNARPIISVLEADQNIQGFAIETILRWSLPGDLRPVIYGSWYHASGGERGDDALGLPFLDSIGFQPLFISRHYNYSAELFKEGGRYGNMDIIPLSNIHIGKIGASIQPADKVTLGLTYLLATVDEDEGYGSGVYGHEFDLFANYEYRTNVWLTANLSLFLPQGGAKRFSDLIFFPDTGTEEPGAEMAVAFYFQALVEF